MIKYSSLCDFTVKVIFHTYLAYKIFQVFKG